jgi:serine phosphatase RsbU (regulator of sigma subunit)
MRVDGHRQFVGVLHDATEREAAERQLRENEQRLQVYYDTQEAATALARTIVGSQLQRVGLQDSSVRHWLEPADNVSGDIVAASRGQDGDLYVLLADATGHGLGAAICSLPVLSTFYSMADMGLALGWIVYEVNRQLRASLPVGHFVAAGMLCVAADGRHADVWVGGIPDVLILDAAGRLRRRVTSTSLPLGIDAGEDSASRPESIELQPGDQFILYSDGLLEAENQEGQAFGYALLFESLAAAGEDGRMDSVKAALERHMGGAKPHDDVSLMLVSCKPAA